MLAERVARQETLGTCSASRAGTGLSGAADEVQKAAAGQAAAIQRPHGAERSSMQKAKPEHDIIRSPAHTRYRIPISQLANAFGVEIHT